MNRTFVNILAALVVLLSAGSVRAEDPPDFLLTWGTYGSGNGEFNYPRGIAVDSQDKVYVTDLYNYRVQKFDSEGNFVLTWGTPGSGNGEFSAPIGIAVDSQDKVYVTDLYNYRVQKFGYVPTGIGDRPTARLPLTVVCYPNPFNPSSTIGYTVPQRGAVTLTVYDVAGRRVATLIDGTVQEAGPHTVEFRHQGASGVYFAKLAVGGQSRTLKLVVLK